MTDWTADAGFTIVVLLTAALTASGGAVRAGTRLIGVILAGLLAMNYFEPLAGLLIRLSNHATMTEQYSRFACLVGLFLLAVILLRGVTNRLLPESPKLPAVAEQAGRWSLGLLTGCVTAMFLLTAVHTFPGPRDFWGYFPPEPEKRPGPVMRRAPEFYWLGYTQYVSEEVFAVGESGPVFDGRQRTIGDTRGRWVSFPLRYAQWRRKMETTAGD